MRFIFASVPAESSRPAIEALYRADETACAEALFATAGFKSEAIDRIGHAARGLVVEVRRRRIGQGGLDAFLLEYGLSSEEGVVLMCLAEALLRIPDDETANRLIRDKLSGADWDRHLGHGVSLFVNASTWTLMLTGKLLRPETGGSDLVSVLRRLLAQGSEVLIRQAVAGAMRILARQFVMGRTIDEALDRAREAESRGYRYSFDMLGEAARTRDDARRYAESYAAAITAIGREARGRGPVEGPGISVKLSALHPRFEFAQRERVLAELVPVAAELAAQAKHHGIGLTIDAEEAETLDLSLDVIAGILDDPRLKGWDGFGLAVQAYQKRAPAVIDWLAGIAAGRRLMVRLVKGAYWDSEIKRSQERGLAGYPVYTRKLATDVSFLACARLLLANPGAFYPQFATHNAHTVAAVEEMAGRAAEFEFQRLHGMGEALHDIVTDGGAGRRCRVYAPVGSHEDLLPYLVRRLLENGANTSFVNRIVDERAPVEALVADPIARLRAINPKPHPRIPLPANLYGDARRNARGYDLTDRPTLRWLAKAMADAAGQIRVSGPIVGGQSLAVGKAEPITDPSDRRRVLGEVGQSREADIDAALTAAAQAAPAWDLTPSETRAEALERVADGFEQHAPELLSLCVREGGRTVAYAVAELREGVDFCRYYAARCRAEFGAPKVLAGPTGGRDEIGLRGRGVFACISPWNFPLAIFTGQVAAALAAGNAVLAKPAEQTPLIAARIVRLFHDCGIPGEVLHLLPGDGESVGGRLVADPRIGGVAFTGSTETARAINLNLARRQGPIVPFIAETGGINAMIVDSSALAEQVVPDILTSAFNSAGQRCSSLRVLFVQDDVAPRIVDMLAGAMSDLVIGDPGLLETDIGPVIDESARDMLARHAARMDAQARLIRRLALPESCAFGTFFAPCVFEIDTIERIGGEVFGPILHVIRYESGKLDKVLDAIEGSGYGLTFGIHSRIESTVEHVRRRLRIGNFYVNRNMIGAVVGVQPFGGEGLSGTGPKAGGPFYLHRFAVERSVATNTTAQGGNAALLSLDEDDPGEGEFS